MNVLVPGSKVGDSIFCPHCAEPDAKKIMVDFTTCRCAGCAAYLSRFENVGMVEWHEATNIARMRMAVANATPPKKTAKKRAKRKCRCRAPSSVCKCGKGGR